MTSTCAETALVELGEISAPFKLLVFCNSPAIFLPWFKLLISSFETVKTHFQRHSKRSASNSPSLRELLMPAPILCSYLNLNLEARRMFLADATNPLIDPLFCRAWVDRLHRQRQVDCSFGGYLEDRSFLWRGSYLRPGHSVHLGVDVNVPAGTAVHCPQRFEVVDLFCDPDQDGGWGGRCVLNTERGLVIFAHLVLNPRLRVGSKYGAGYRIGIIADHTANGGWFPHLHLQGISALEALPAIDGYGRRSPRNAVLFPEPLQILGID